MRPHPMSRTPGYNDDSTAVSTQTDIAQIIAIKVGDAKFDCSGAGLRKFVRQTVGYASAMRGTVLHNHFHQVGDLV